MTTIPLDVADTVYRCASTYTVHRHHIKYDEFRKFCVELSLFQDRLGDLAHDDYWPRFLTPLRHLRFELCAAPYLNGHRDKKIENVCSDVQKYLQPLEALYPDFKEPAFHLLGSLRNLIGDNKNPFLEELIALSASSHQVAWVIKESRFLPQIDQLVGVDANLRDRVEPLHPSQLSDTRFFDTLIVVGSPKWFPDSVFTSPRASEIHIVQYSWIRDSWRLPEAFVAPYKTKHARNITLVDEAPQDDDQNLLADSLVHALDSHTLIRSTHRDGYQEYEEIDASCVILEGGEAILFEADASSTILVIDIDEEEDERVKSISVKDLEIGTFILVRTGGGADYIVPLADQFMGDDAQLARNRQHHWKNLLKQYVVENGLAKTVVDLLKMGSSIANEMNVRNWMFPRNIKTRDFEDFLAIMRLVGLEPQAISYWNTMEFISSAHRKAGFELRRVLLDQVNMLDLIALKRIGKMEFKLSEDDREAGLTAFRVEKILPEVFKVPISRIGVPLKLES